jgi:hypothetical protein
MGSMGWRHLVRSKDAVFCASRWRPASRAGWENGGAAALRAHVDLLDASELSPADGRLATTLTLWIGAWPNICIREQLLQDALDDGGTDNITLIVGRAIKRGE